MNGAWKNSNELSTLGQLNEYGRFISAKTLHLEEPDLDEDSELILLADWRTYQIQNVKTLEEPRTLSEKEVHGFIIVAANSPFESIDENRLQEGDAEAQEIISRVHLLASDFEARLSARLQFLFESAKEEDPEQIAISPHSLKDFFAFLESLATDDLRYPDIVLSPTKNVRAIWQSGRSKRIVIDFLGNRRVQFVVFRPDPKDAQNPIRLSGFSSVESTMEEIVVPNKVDWISDEPSYRPR
jgi:hypothetical protein